MVEYRCPGGSEAEGDLGVLVGPAAAIAVTFPDDASAELREIAVAGVREAATTLSRRIRGTR